MPVLQPSHHIVSQQNHHKPPCIRFCAGTRTLRMSRVCVLVLQLPHHIGQVPAEPSQTTTYQVLRRHTRHAHVQGMQGGPVSRRRVQQEGQVVGQCGCLYGGVTPWVGLHKGTEEVVACPATPRGRLQQRVCFFCARESMYVYVS